MPFAVRFFAVASSLGASECGYGIIGSTQIQREMGTDEQLQINRRGSGVFLRRQVRHRKRNGARRMRRKPRRRELGAWPTTPERAGRRDGRGDLPPCRLRVRRADERPGTRGRRPAGERQLPRGGQGRPPDRHGPVQKGRARLVRGERGCRRRYGAIAHAEKLQSEGKVVATDDFSRADVQNRLLARDLAIPDNPIKPIGSYQLNNKTVVAEIRYQNMSIFARDLFRALARQPVAQ